MSFYTKELKKLDEEYEKDGFYTFRHARIMRALDRDEIADERYIKIAWAAVFIIILLSLALPWITTAVQLRLIDIRLESLFGA